jgi:multidrug resistance efflux pump
MELLMILTYAAICYAIFKIFRIPVNKWTIPTAVLGGIILIAMILLVMNYNHPYTRDARIYFATTPILPVVQGEVIDVPVTPNVPLKKGDVLFQIDPRPYEYVVEQLKAALAAAEASVEEARAARDRAKQSFDRYAAGNEQARAAGRIEPFPEIQVENQRGIYLASEAALLTAQAIAEQARLAYEAQIGGINPTVARLQAELRDAEYELDKTTVRAPSEGYVTQLFLRPGMMAVPMPLRPVMVFIPGENTLGAAFQQNALQRVRAGDEAEIAFDALPGRIIKGRVATVLEAVAQGQLAPTGELIAPEQRQGPGRAIASIDIEDDLSGYQVPPGAAAQVAVYTEHWHHFAVIRRILLRMKSWMNYVFTEGH